jgi:hypothetical protein
MKYKKYWSIADLPNYSLRAYDVFFYISIVFILAFILTKIFKKNNEDYEKTIVLWATGIIGIGTLIGFIYLKFFIKDLTDQHIQRILNSKNVAVVEGNISNFQS